MESIFTEAYSRLNKQQKEAVDTIEGPVMVIAGPGTGKTTILTLRIANILLTTDTPASGILAITYTDAGVKAMRSKLREVAGTRADEVKIFTFHSFASSIITEFPEHFPHLYGSVQLTDVEGDVLLREILKSDEFADLRPLGKPDLYLSSIVRAISDSKREGRTPEDVKKYAKNQITRITSDESRISTRGATKGQLKAEAKKEIERLEKTILFADVYKIYEKNKIEGNKIDYDDLILELIKAFDTDELLLRLVQERYLYIHIDEHQDTNDSQNKLIAFLANFFDTPNVFIVGDEKQAIYRFQGASVQNFLKFEKAWKDIKVIPLQVNYRSHRAILDSAFSLIEHNYEGEDFRSLRVQLKSSVNHKERPIDYVVAETELAKERELVSRINEIRTSDPKASIVVIVRKNRELSQLLQLLQLSGIEVSSERKVDIFSHPVGILFFDLLEYLSDPLRSEILPKCLIAGLFGKSFIDSLRIIGDIRKGNMASALREIPAMASIRNKINGDAPLSFIIELARLSGLNTILVREPANMEVWRGIVELAQAVIKNTNIHSPMKLIEALLTYRLASESRNVKVSVGSSDYPVKAMTAHGSKGLEFDYVIIPHATEESWIGRHKSQHFILEGRNDIEDDIRDARRLFYVALTRAKKHAIIMRADVDYGGRVLEELRFMTEINPSFVNKSRAKTLGYEARIITDKELENSDTQIIDYAKNSLESSGLSVTALNHFLKCPNQFLYQSVFRIPQAPSASAEKGNVMHEAFSRVWKSEKRGQSDIEMAIKESVQNFESNSLLPVYDKKAVVKELSENASIVAKALADHFAQSGRVYTEEWSKTKFDTKYLDKKVRIDVHGKLDVIVDGGKIARVFDYKTKQVMSEASIRGETKSSDGDYFRQLTFYKYLLDRDTRIKGREIEPALVFLTPDNKGRCQTVALPVTDKDISALEKSISSLVEAIWSGRIVTEFCDEPTCEWCALRKLSTTNNNG